MLSRAARDMEFAVSAVGSAEAALEHVQSSAVDIVVTDLHLPAMQGMELCARLHERDPELPIIILTGYGSLDAAQSAIRLDVVDFLTKPCALRDLEEALNRAVRRRLTIGKRRRPSVAQAPTEPDGQPRTLDEVEREQIYAALERHDGNRAKTAAALGISVRTLYYRLNEYEEQDRRAEERASGEEVS